MNASADFSRTQSIQWDASDPAASAWVVANAGSGKTHVLTQRVIRLLLSGADPAAILCLTFTKVAAAEMARRIFEKLGGWTTLPEPELREAIKDLQGRPPSPLELQEARRLFARALETPGGLKIQTVHAFCERLLHQFPFEANVPGQFAILDDTSAGALIAEARAEVMSAAALAPQSRLGAAMRYLAENASDAEIGRALDCVIAEREAIRRWMDKAAAESGLGSVEDALADLRGRLGLTAGETASAICRDICRAAHWSRADCATLTEALTTALAEADHSYDRTAHALLSRLAKATEHEAEAEDRLDFFLIEGKEGWKSRSASHRFSAAFARAQAGMPERFAAEADRLVALTVKLQAARSFEATGALLVLGDAILQSYHAVKKRSGFLDFGDLIVKTRNLLSRADAAQWVLYKLDARIEHILVDEAQDTSPDQWAVVQAIAADFFAGANAARRPRTVFAVGDDKQSIFGFQGAAPHMLADMQRFFAGRVKDGKGRFVERPLYLSFRSTNEVLDAVDRVFSGRPETEVTASGYVPHAAHRLDAPGRVTVLPRIVRRSTAQPEDWTTPFDAPTAAEVALAEQIAGEINGLIGTHLPSGKIVQAGEVLILTRKRGAFVTAMNRALRANGISAAGADRIPVATHIAVMDLLALADVMLLPEDELQLAACLKSPLLGLTEGELMRLATERDASLWAALTGTNDLVFGTAAARLRAWRGMADQMTPFRFFATVLGPDGGRRAFRERLGGEADDVLDAFLSQALNYEAVEPPSLQGFLRYLRASQNDIKREVEEASSGVRIMTVHGAKGLEADVVFLADTGSQIVHGSHRAVLVDIGVPGDPAFLWRRAAKDATELQRGADLAADAETKREYLRLLYVAMTRARDLLYLCGIRSEKKEVEGCWYSLVQQALVPAETERDAETGELVAPYRWPEPPRPPLSPRHEAPPSPEQAGTLPQWLSRPAPTARAAPQPLRPSRALAEPDPRPDFGGSAAALAGAGGGLVRGRMLHRLLQLLPGPPGDRRAVAAERVMRELPDDPELAASVLHEVEAVLAEPALAAYFGPDARAEVPIVGQVETARGAYAVSGRIDRLLRDPAGWRILDFKTDRVVPASPEAADPATLLQMALYRRLLQGLEPGVPVEALIVWTAGPKIMPLPPRAMEQALAGLGIRDMGFA